MKDITVDSVLNELVLPAIKATAVPEDKINHYDERRNVSGGMVKDTLTGFVEYPTTTPRDDFPPDLPSNNGGF
jgi:hypothetical protein